MLIDKIEGIEVDQEPFSFFKEIIYKDKAIFFLDLSNMSPDDVIESVPKTVKMVRSRPPKSVLMLTDMTGMRYNSESLDVAKSYTKGNETVMKKSAIFGIDGLKRVTYNAVVRFSGRKNVRAISKIEEALEWLVSE